MELKLYICSHCGNVVWKAVDKGVPIICCGEPMKELVPGATDGAVEKHVPQITRDGDLVTIRVGSVTHPMVDEHYISLIAAVYGDRIKVRMTKSGDDPVLELSTREHVTAYALCNLHGYWKSEE
jgi:superoxide reductase